MKNLLLIVLAVLFCMPVLAEGNKKYKKVKQIYPVYLEICKLSEEQKTDLYDLLIQRQDELDKCKKEYKARGEKANDALTVIRNDYLSKMEELIGEENMKKMREYKSSQMRFDLKELEANL